MSACTVHCSYHKCLTRYYVHIFSRLYNFPAGRNRYRHFNSNLKKFQQQHNNYRVASVNNQYVGQDVLNTCRISRFVRDPRDLVISGYFYHLRGAEKWCHVTRPVDADWLKVKGCVPAGMSGEQTYTAYLNTLSLEDGLMAEIEFRRYHFESMRSWPARHENIRLFRYEDFIGNEVNLMTELFSFHKLDWSRKFAGRILARRNIATGNTSKRPDKGSHIRDPNPNQWKRYFTAKVNRNFQQQYGDLLENLGYD